MLTKSEKAEIVQRYATKNPQDTGSAVVQIALLSKRIESVQEHLKKFDDDHASRRGLLQMVGQRRSLLTYLKGKDSAAYDKLRSDLDLN